MSPFWILLRWLCLAPACFIAAAVAYLVETIVNGLFGGLVSGVVTLLGVAAAGYVSVTVAQLLAPTVKRAAGAAIVVCWFLFATYASTNAVLPGANRHSVYPLWYLLLMFVVLLSGAIAALSVAYSGESAPASPTVSTTLRWILALPMAIAGSVIVIAATAALMYSSSGAGNLILLESQFLSPVVFIGILTAVVPLRRVIVSILGGLWAVTGTIYIVVGVFRPVVKALLERVGRGQFDFRYAPSDQALQGVAWLAAGLLPIVVIYTNKRAQKV